MTAHLFSPAGHRNSLRLRNNEMLGRIDRFDWQGTPLGPIAAWPEALRAATRLMLCAAAPIAIIAGRDGWFILNDAMRETLGLDCDAVLGRSVLEALPRAAPFYRAVIARCAAGEAPRFENQPLALLRGRRTTAWFNLDFAPVLDVDGNYLASMVIASETTARVRAERALQRSAVARDGGVGRRRRAGARPPHQEHVRPDRRPDRPVAARPAGDAELRRAAAPAADGAEPGA
jgi:PAS domain S-box-containing protein